jgi:hypothetical protein
MAALHRGVGVGLGRCDGGVAELVAEHGLLIDPALAAGPEPLDLDHGLFGRRHALSPVWWEEVGESCLRGEAGASGRLLPGWHQPVEDPLG